MGQNLPTSAFFAIFRPLKAIKHHQTIFFLQRRFYPFIWWVICKNWLRIGFRNKFLTFTTENQVDLDELQILKITFKNGLGIGRGNLPQHFPQEFPARFSRKISCKIFPQEFPARFSCKIFPQDFPQDSPTRFSARFPTSFSCKITHKIFPQDFPQDFPTRFPTRFSCKISRKISCKKVIFKICNSSRST